MIARARRRRWDPARDRLRAGPDPAGEPRPAPRRSRLSRARELPAGPRPRSRERIDELKLHEIRAHRRRGAGNRLRLYRAAARKPGAAGRHCRRRQSEKLDRTARRLHPRHRRRDARLRPHRGRLSRPALCRDQPAHVSRCWCARVRGCRRSVSAAATRCSTPRRCAHLHARERLVDADDADVSEGVAVSVDLSGLGPGGLVGYRAKRHTGRDRCRAPRRLCGRRFLGADRRRAPTAA